MAEQVINFDLLGLMGIAEFRQVSGQRRIQIDDALFCQLHDGQSRKGFGDGSHAHNGVFIELHLLFHIPVPEKLLVQCLFVIDNSNRHAGGIIMFHDLAHQRFKTGAALFCRSVHFSLLSPARPGCPADLLAHLPTLLLV